MDHVSFIHIRKKKYFNKNRLLENGKSYKCTKIMAKKKKAVKGKKLGFKVN